MPYVIDEIHCRNLDYSSNREWILVNGLGGYAMGTVSGMNTRRYHGHLVASIEPPVQRMLLLSGIEATVEIDGNPIYISTNQYPGAVFPEGYQYLEAFELSENTATWRFRIGKVRFEKSMTMVQGRNEVHITFKNLGPKSVRLSLRPLISHRDHHGNFVESANYPEDIEFETHSTNISHHGVTLQLWHPNAERTPVQGWYYRLEHAVEIQRGLDPRDDLYCPCDLQCHLEPTESFVLTALQGEGGPSEPMLSSDSTTATSPRLSVQLREAAQKFLVKSPNRTTIVAGYPWFTDWGRDTMISIPGICLHTGEFPAARQILMAYANQLHHGLIPNRFVEAGETPDYNTVDATLWFVQAAYRTLVADWDPTFAQSMIEVFEQIYAHHVKGTLFGIHVDPNDGLLSQGEPGTQLTWMDAKVGDWVVTPRHGKPVEINGLWINALRVMEWLAEELNTTGEKFRRAAERAETSFNAKFWCPSRQHYFDTVDPLDATLRPNQLIAMSLPFGPATGERAQQALEVIERELVTPFGLRTLGPQEPGYRGRFKGPLPELDAAYHQGTIWPWLLGPYITAKMKLGGDAKDARQLVRHAKELLVDRGLGGIAEVYDGDEPRSAGGCPWQAWSVAEILRAWVEDLQGDDQSYS